MFKNVYSLYSAFFTQPAFYSQSAVCILQSVCSLHFTVSLHFTPGPQSAVCSLQSAVRSPQSAFYTDRLNNAGRRHAK